MASDIVQISKRRRRAPLLERLQNAPMVHKFFLVGAFFGVLGTAWLGVHLWLMLNGQVHMHGMLYFIFKNLHALVQFHFFLGLFIVGFYLQTAPKLFEIPDPTPRWTLLILVPLLLAGICLVLLPHLHIHRYLVAVSFFATAAVITNYYRRATLENRLRMGVLSIFGLCSLGASSFLDLTNPLIAVTVFWCGIFSVILAVSQQFIIWILGGKKLRPAQSSILLILYFAAATCSILVLTFPDFQPLGFRLFAIFSLLSAQYLFIATRAAAISWRRLSDPLALALSMAQFWAVVGCILLFFGPQNSDATLHLWATGIAVTMVIAVSSRVVGVLSGKDVFGSRTLLLLLLAWQIVPLGRGLRYALALPSWFSWITGAAAIGVFFVWSASIFWRIARILYRQFTLRQNEEMVGC